MREKQEVTGDRGTGKGREKDIRLLIIDSGKRLRESTSAKSIFVCVQRPLQDLETYLHGSQFFQALKIL